jgi:putative ABC transport system permease protein
MRALDRKLFRDLATLKGQAAAIAVVIACGVMTLIISVSTMGALALTQERFYQDSHFADVFADLKRAPDSLAQRLREIPGVNVAETRVKAAVRLQVPGFDDPVRGLLVSIPDGRQPLLNRLYLREGRLPESGRSDEVAISDAFAEAHGLRAGDPLRAIINGRLTTLRVSGVVLSPEFVYQIAPTDLLPDYERYGILWMNRRALGSAYGMDGAFNNVVISLQAGASEPEVVAHLDRILARYGGIGAHGRWDQSSHRFLEEELRQLRAQAAILPTIFLLVSPSC